MKHEEKKMEEEKRKQSLSQGRSDKVMRYLLKPSEYQQILNERSLISEDTGWCLQFRKDLEKKIDYIQAVLGQIG